MLEHLAPLIPAKKSANGSRERTGDNSRSAAAFRKGAALRREGKTFEEMCEALRTDPETAEWYRQKGEASGGRELRRIWDRAKPKDATPAPQISEDELALQFTERHADKLRYVAIWGSWMFWTGSLWVREKTLKAYDLARAIARDTPGAKRSAKTVAAVENLARSDRQHARTHDE